MKAARTNIDHPPRSRKPPRIVVAAESLINHGRADQAQQQNQVVHTRLGALLLSYSGSPTRRSRCLNRGSDRTLSIMGSTFSQPGNAQSRSLYALSSHLNAVLFP